MRILRLLAISILIALPLAYGLGWFTRSGYLDDSPEKPTSVHRRPRPATPPPTPQPTYRSMPDPGGNPFWRMVAVARYLIKQDHDRLAVLDNDLVDFYWHNVPTRLAKNDKHIEEIETLLYNRLIKNESITATVKQAFRLNGRRFVCNATITIESVEIDNGIVIFTVTNWSIDQ